MKDKIKEILRENHEKNSLGVLVTRPSQELIVMRGVPGAGKSTRAKSLVGNGVIHSTDSVIERSHDYKTFFNTMVETKDFSPLSKAHAQNLREAIASMKDGKTPVIIDNTNIKQNESKAYVKAALEMGYSDKNIKFVDVGTAGLSAEILAERNTHGVPLDKIKQMIASHTGQGKLTLESVLSSKDMYETKKNDVLYSAVVLDTASHNKLLEVFDSNIPTGWTKIAHHMTIEFGKGVEDKSELGRIVNLRVMFLGSTDKAMAVRVEGYPSKNRVAHITLAVNPDGGKPQMSNDITTWVNVKPFFVTGVVTEIKK